VGGQHLAVLPPEVRAHDQVNSLVIAQGVFLGTNEGLFLLAQASPSSNAAFVPVSQLNRLLGADKWVRQVAVGPNGKLAVAAASGLFYSQNLDQWKALYPHDDSRRWAPHDVRAVAFDQRARLWFASPQGVGCLDVTWTLYTGAEGLTYNDFTSIAAGPGDIWFGTHIGAIHFDGGHWAYREGKRWLPHNEVRAIAVTPEGRAWFATPQGLGVIERRPTTLAEKARFYEDEIDKRHRRTPYEYVSAVRLKRPGDKSEWIQHDTDNDGQYTGMYGAAECFAYAATKDPGAKKRATAAFEALRSLTEVTQGGSHPAPKGFPARAILPTSGPDPNDYYTIEKDLEGQKGDALWKVMHTRWPTSEDGQWYWKCDTSSDELDGHFFLYARYYDLVAETEEEKERVRQVVRAIADHLIENDFRLIDWDGKPTRWANFSPDSLNRDPDWWTERGLNSLSILAYLRTAEHITADEKYGAVADTLARKHAYAMNAMYPKLQRGPGSYVQFDDEMAFMNYYNLLQYEKDPELRQMFAASCFQYWELEECELNAFFNFAYAACCQGETVASPWGTVDLSPKRECLEDAVETLKRYPLDLVNWKLTNSHRKDILPLPKYVREPSEDLGKGCRVNGEVLPIDERHTTHWADDPWALDSGGDGAQLATGYPFLLAYYMGLYHGFIIEE